MDRTTSTSPTSPLPLAPEGGSGHTPGPWQIDPAGPGRLSVRYYFNDRKNAHRVATVMECRGEQVANARLIAAAPDGLNAAVMAYLALLQLPHGSMRLACQATLCALRDFIAKATGNDAEDVQNMFEERARAEGR